MSKPASRASHGKQVEVEQIRAIRYDSTTKQTHCLIKFKDCPEDENEWVLLKHVHCDELMKQAQAHQADPNSKWTWEFYLDKPQDHYPAAGWYPYDTAAQHSMSRFFHKYCQDAQQTSMLIECVASGRFMYEVDFEHMRQTNVAHVARTQRPIRGVPK